VLSASAALGRLTGTYRYAYANEGRESGIGGERRIFLPKREGYKYEHISYEKDTS
jgi:hypothetical protein